MTQDGGDGDDGSDKAGELLASVVEETGHVPGAGSVSDLGEGVVRLSGGVDAATYLLRAPGTHAVVKIAEDRLEAEAQALRAWRHHTPRVPEVLGSGVVPSTADSEKPLRYLVLGVLLDEQGRVVRTAADHLEDHGDDARAVGRAFGAELELLHRAVGPGTFGDFGDSPGAGRTYDTWAGYLADYWDQQADFLRDLDVTEELRTAVRDRLASCPSVDRGRFLHGDASIRNTAVLATGPAQVGLFDPNPLLGDPTWDLAPVVNNAALDARLRERRGGEVDRCSSEVLAGFREGYGGDVAAESLLAARLVQATMQAQAREAARDDGDLDEDEAAVGRELVHDLLRELCG